MSVWNGNYQSPNWSGNTTTNSKNLVVSSIQTNYISTGKLYAGDGYISTMTTGNINVSTITVSTLTADLVNSSNVSIYGYTGNEFETPHPGTLNFYTSTPGGVITTTISAYNDGILNSGTLVNAGDATFTHNLNVLGTMYGSDIYASNITASNNLTGSNLTAQVAQIQDGYGTASLSIYGATRINPLNALYVEGNTQIYHRLKVSDSTYGIADLNVYGANHIVGDNALYVEGGTTLTGGGVIHGVTLGALRAAGVDTVRLEVLPGGIYLTTLAPLPIAINSLAAVTINAGGAANIAAGGAVSIAGGDYVEINTSAIKCINTTNPGCNVLNVDTIFPSETVTGTLNRFNLNQISTAQISTITNDKIITNNLYVDSITDNGNNINMLSRVDMNNKNIINAAIIQTATLQATAIYSPTNTITMNTNVNMSGNNISNVNVLLASNISTNNISTNIGFVKSLTTPSMSTNTIASYNTGSVAFANAIVMNNQNIFGANTIEISSITTTSPNVAVYADLNMKNYRLSNVSSITTNQAFVSTLFVDSISTGNIQYLIPSTLSVSTLIANSVSTNILSTNVGFIKLLTAPTTTTNAINSYSSGNVSFLNDIVLNNNNLLGVKNIQVSSMTSQGIGTAIAVLTAFDMKQNDVNNVNNVRTNNLYVNTISNVNTIYGVGDAAINIYNVINKNGTDINNIANVQTTSISAVNNSQINITNSVNMSGNNISNVNVLLASNISTNNISTNIGFVKSLTTPSMSTNTITSYNTGSVAFPNAIVMCNQNIYGANTIEISSITTTSPNVAVYADLNMKQYRISNVSSVTTNQAFVSTLFVSTLLGYNISTNNISTNSGYITLLKAPVIQGISTLEFFNNSFDGTASLKLSDTGYITIGNDAIGIDMCNLTIKNALNIIGTNLKANYVSTGTVSTSELIVSQIDGFPASLLDPTPQTIVNTNLAFTNKSISGIATLAAATLFSGNGAAPIYVVSDFHMSNHNITNANNIIGTNLKANYVSTGTVSTSELIVSQIDGFPASLLDPTPQTIVNTNLAFTNKSISGIATLAAATLFSGNGAAPIYVVSDFHMSNNSITNANNLSSSNVITTHLTASDITGVGGSVTLLTNMDTNMKDIYNVNHLTTSFIQSPTGYPIYVNSRTDYQRSNFLSNVSTIYMNSGTLAPLSISADGQTLKLNGSNIGGGGGGWTPIATSDLDMHNYSIFSTNKIVASNISTTYLSSGTIASCNVNISQILAVNTIDAYTGSVINFNKNITTSNDITISGNDGAKAKLILDNPTHGQVSFYVDDGGNMIQSCTTGGASYFIRNTGGSGGKITLDYSGLGDADMVLNNIDGQAILTLSNYNTLPVRFPDGIQMGAGNLIADYGLLLSNIDGNTITVANGITITADGIYNANIYIDVANNLNLQAYGEIVNLQSHIDMLNNNISNVDTINFNKGGNNANIYMDDGNNLTIKNSNGNSLIINKGIYILGAACNANIYIVDNILTIQADSQVLKMDGTSIDFDGNNISNLGTLHVNSVYAYDSDFITIYNDLNMNSSNITTVNTIDSVSISTINISSAIIHTSSIHATGFLHTDKIIAETASYIQVRNDLNMCNNSISNVASLYTSNIYSAAGTYINIMSPTLFSNGVGLQGNTISNIGGLDFTTSASHGAIQYMNEGAPGYLFNFSGTLYGGLDIDNKSLYNVANTYTQLLQANTISNATGCNIDVRGIINMCNNNISNVANISTTSIVATTINTTGNRVSDLWVTNINGSAYSGGSWVGTATSDLNMNNYSITNAKNISGVSSITQNLYIAKTGITFQSFSGVTAGAYSYINISTMGSANASLVLSNADNTPVILATGLDLARGNITNVTQINGATYPPPLVWDPSATSGLDMNGYDITNVNHITSISSITSNVFIKYGSTYIRQPFIQRGNFQVNHATATDATHSIIMPVSYNNYDYAVSLVVTWGTYSNAYDVTTPLPVVTTQNNTYFTFHYTPSAVYDYRINWITFGEIT